MPRLRNRRRRFKYTNRTKVSLTTKVESQETKVEVSKNATKKNETKTVTQVKKKAFAIQELESVVRITNLPIVESGWWYAENFYRKIKKSHTLVYWTLGQAEQSFQTVVDTALPAMVLLQGPLTSIDRIVCKSLDLVEEKVPSINLPPEMIYWNTKQYVSNVSNKIVRPVLKRADSVKQIGNTVLASKYTAFAADRLDGALDVADKYVDKYLPSDDDQCTDEVDKPVDGPVGKAIHTIYHVDRFSRKLQRRLTKRTLAEVKALKEQSAEAVHVLIYVAELIATDPKLAFEKGKELWLSLSKDEPENQARPENLEQLIVLLTRESARRLVHLINFTSALVTKIPRKVSKSALSMLNKLLHLADSTVKTVHLEGLQEAVVAGLKYRVHQFTVVLKHLNTKVTDLLEHLAQSLAQPEPPKSALSVPKIKVQQLKATHRNSSSNGVENNS